MTPTREELLTALAALSETAPELRLGQLLANLATAALGTKVEAIWDAEDEDLLRADQHLLGLEHYRSRNATPPPS